MWFSCLAALHQSKSAGASNIHNLLTFFQFRDIMKVFGSRPWLRKTTLICQFRPFSGGPTDFPWSACFYTMQSARLHTLSNSTLMQGILIYQAHHQIFYKLLCSPLRSEAVRSVCYPWGESNYRVVSIHCAQGEDEFTDWSQRSQHNDLNIDEFSTLCHLPKPNTLFLGLNNCFRKPFLICSTIINSTDSSQ